MMRILRRLSGHTALAGVVLLIAGCGSAVFGQVNLYVANLGNLPPNLNEYTINTSNGSIVPVVGQATTTTDNNPTRVAMTPDGRFLYVAAQNDFVDAFSVSSTGFLTALTPFHYTVANAPLGIVVDPTSRFLYVSGGNKINVFTIDSTTGALTPVTCALCTLPSGSFAQGMAVDPTGNFLYIALTGTHKVGVGTIVQSGASAGSLNTFVTPVTGGSFFDPIDLVLNPGGTYLYVIDGLGSNVLAYSVSGATMNLVGTYATGSTPLGIAMDPTGKFLYTTNNGDNNISGFIIGSGGTLTNAPHSPYAAGSAPVGVSVEPTTGKFMYVSNHGDNTVNGYAITQSGANAGDISLINSGNTGTGPFYLLAHIAPPATTVPAASTWSLAALGVLLAGVSGLLYRKAYR